MCNKLSLYSLSFFHGIKDVVAPWPAAVYTLGFGREITLRSWSGAVSGQWEDLKQKYLLQLDLSRRYKDNNDLITSETGDAERRLFKV